MTYAICQERERHKRTRLALRQLLAEVVAAGFESAIDYNWPKAIADAREALGDTNTDKHCPHGLAPRSCSDCSY